MKQIVKFLRILLVCVLFIGCKDNYKDQGVNRQKLTNTVVSSPSGESTYGLEVYTMDSCEYIGKLKNQSDDWAAHRGQCKYCRKRRIEEMKEAIKEYFEGR